LFETVVDMFDPTTAFIITATFLLAGMVKGVIGLGLPTVSLGLLAASFDLTTAMSLLIVPSFATNVWQATVGGHLLPLLKRLWLYLLIAGFTVGIGSIALVTFDLSHLSMMLGGLLIAYALLSLSGFRLTLNAQQERLAAPILGSVNGILTGMTGTFVIPGVMYLQGIGLTRDQLVQAMGLLFTVSTVALAIALQYRELSTAQLNLTSLAAVLPAVAGMWIGQRLRRRLSEQHFRLVFFNALLLLGIYIILKAWIA